MMRFTAEQPGVHVSVLGLADKVAGADEELAGLDVFELFGNPRLAHGDRSGYDERQAARMRQNEGKLRKYLSRIREPVAIYVPLSGGSMFGLNAIDFRRFVDYRRFTQLLMQQYDLDEPPIRHRAQHINVFLVGSGRPDPDRNPLMAVTPWIAVHKIMHAWPGREEQRLAWEDLYRAFRQTMFDLYPAPPMAAGVGGAKSYRDAYNRAGQAEKEKLNLEVMHRMFTFGAARRGKIATSPEGIIELMVQRVVTGRNDMNLPPERLETNGSVMVRIPENMALFQTDRLGAAVKRAVEEGAGKAVGMYTVV